jgi:hypothetical protein
LVHSRKDNPLGSAKESKGICEKDEKSSRWKSVNSYM